MTGTGTGAALHVSGRTAAVGALVTIAVALGCRLLDTEQSSFAALTILSATLVVGVVPGVLVTLLWRPRSELTALEVIGFGIAISLGLVQVLTILAVSAHLNAAVMLALLVAVSVLLAARVIRRPAGTILLTLDELLVCLLLLAVSVLLYGLGSPVTSTEDQVHAAIVRRLSQLAAPRLDNLYFAPGIVYTYPFPGIHYLMALVARLGDIDQLFLYHKLRFFWSPAALVMLYLSARAVFGSEPDLVCFNLVCIHRDLGAEPEGLFATGQLIAIRGVHLGKR